MTTPADEASSNLPPAARRQVAEANRLIAELNARPGEIPAGAEYAPNPGDVQPGANETGQRRWQPASATMATAAAAPPPAAAAPVVDPAAIAPVVEDTYEQRYRVLQGKYDAELRAARAESSSIREAFSEQQKTINALVAREAPAREAPAPADPKDFLKSLGVTEKEMDDYGELLPIVAKMAQNMIRPTAQKLEQEVNRVKQDAQRTSSAVVQDRQASLFSVMDNQVPGWRVQNDDPKFLDWLDGFDIFSGRTRRQGLEQAFGALDATRVIGIFKAYLQEDSANRSASGPTIDRETLVAPGVPRGGMAEAPGGAAGKRIVSENEVQDFYSRVRRKLVPKDEYDRFSEELAQAVAEGRVRPAKADHHLNGR